MAKFNATGIEGLMIDLEEFAQIPDEIIEEMLDAGAKVVEAAHKASIMRHGLYKTGRLVGSIHSIKKAGGRGNDFKRYVLVYPTGGHHTYRRKQVTKTYKNSKSGRTYSLGGDIKLTTSSDVGFIHEFGAPRKGIKATNWMKEANEKCAGEMTDAEFRVYDNWLKTKNL